MNYSTQIPMRKLCFILSLLSVAFTIVSSYLFMKHQINVMQYSTPVILVTVLAIITCGVLNKVFKKLLSEFGFKSTPITQEPATIIVPIEEAPVEDHQPEDTIQEEKEPVTPPINITINLENSGSVQPATAKSNILDSYEEAMEINERKSRERRIEIMNAVREYTIEVMPDFLSKEDLATLLENINYMSCGDTDKYVPLRSKIDNPLKSPDLRHFAWNIGHRLNIPMRDRALFIKSVFPFELREATIEYLEKNLRDSVPSKIKIDVPKKGDYRFKCMMKEAA